MLDMSAWNTQACLALGRGDHRLGRRSIGGVACTRRSIRFGLQRATRRQVVDFCFGRGLGGGDLHPTARHGGAGLVRPVFYSIYSAVGLEPSTFETWLYMVAFFLGVVQHGFFTARTKPRLDGWIMPPVVDVRKRCLTHGVVPFTVR